MPWEQIKEKANRKPTGGQPKATGLGFFTLGQTMKRHLKRFHLFRAEGELKEVGPRVNGSQLLMQSVTTLRSNGEQGKELVTRQSDSSAKSSVRLTRGGEGMPGMLLKASS